MNIGKSGLSIQIQANNVNDATGVERIIEIGICKKVFIILKCTEMQAKKLPQITAEKNAFKTFASEMKTDCQNNSVSASLKRVCKTNIGEGKSKDLSVKMLYSCHSRSHTAAAVIFVII